MRRRRGEAGLTTLEWLLVVAAVTELRRRWRAETPTASNIEEINSLYAARCRQLGIIYADISLRVQPPKAGTLDSPNGGWETEPSCTLA